MKIQTKKELKNWRRRRRRREKEEKTNWNWFMKIVFIKINILFRIQEENNNYIQ
jgi:hypothetical protein